MASIQTLILSESPHLDLYHLARLASSGSISEQNPPKKGHINNSTDNTDNANPIPENTLRVLTYSLLLKYLPSNTSDAHGLPSTFPPTSPVHETFPYHLKVKRDEYKLFCKEFFYDNTELCENVRRDREGGGVMRGRLEVGGWNNNANDSSLASASESASKPPSSSSSSLSPSSSSPSSSSSSPPSSPSKSLNSGSLGLESNSSSSQLLDTILKDVIRTFPSLHFYIDPINSVQRYMTLTRVLYVWSTLNSGVSYVQGMNEIVGVLFYVIGSSHLSTLPQQQQQPACLTSHGKNNVEDEDLEADLYNLFTLIMNLPNICDLYVPLLDQSKLGLSGRISSIESLLHLHDPSLQEHLESLGVQGDFYALRWLTTFFAREYTLPDTIRLWDSMLSSPNLSLFLSYISCTMVMLMRETLLVSDFTGAVNCLQGFPPEIDVEDVVRFARGLAFYEVRIEHIFRQSKMAHLNSNSNPNGTNATDTDSSGNTVKIKKYRSQQNVMLDYPPSSFTPPPSLTMAYSYRHGIIPPDQVHKLQLRDLKLTSMDNAKLAQEAARVAAVKYGKKGKEGVRGFMKWGSRVYGEVKREYGKVKDEIGREREDEMVVRNTYGGEKSKGKVKGRTSSSSNGTGRTSMTSLGRTSSIGSNNSYDSIDSSTPTQLHFNEKSQSFENFNSALTGGEGEGFEYEYGLPPPAQVGAQLNSLPEVIPAFLALHKDSAPINLELLSSSSNSNLTTLNEEGVEDEGDVNTDDGDGDSSSGVIRRKSAAEVFGGLQVGVCDSESSNGSNFGEDEDGGGGGGGDDVLFRSGGGGDEIDAVYSVDDDDDGDAGDLEGVESVNDLSINEAKNKDKDEGKGEGGVEDDFLRELGEM